MVYARTTLRDPFTFSATLYKRYTPRLLISSLAMAHQTSHAPAANTQTPNVTSPADAFTNLRNPLLSL